MFRKNLQKTDNFYFAFGAVMIVCALFIVFVFKTIFESVNTVADIGTQFTEVELKINKENLDKALKIAEEKKVIHLEVR